MTDAAFQSECQLIIDAILGPADSSAAQDNRSETRSILLKSTLEESRRIFRLCLHHKLQIAQHSHLERVYCICCALATSQPHIWHAIHAQVATADMRSSMGARRQRGAGAGTWRIPKMGDIVMKEVNRFIQVACAALKLNLPTFDIANESAAAEELIANEHEKPAKVDLLQSRATRTLSKLEAHEMVSLAATSSNDAPPPARSVKVKRNLKKVDDDDAEAAQFSGLDDLPEDACETEDAAIPSSDAFASSTNLLVGRDWNAVRDDVVRFQRLNPSWRCGVASPASWMPLVGSPRLAAPISGSVNCHACAADAAALAKTSKSRDAAAVVATGATSGPVYQCVRCGLGYHRGCMVPQQHDVLEPFVCCPCRLDAFDEMIEDRATTGPKKRERSADEGIGRPSMLELALQLVIARRVSK